MNQKPVGDGTRLESTHQTPAFGIRMRPFPDPDLPPVASMPGHSPVRVLDQQGRWAEIATTTGETGWVYANQLTPLPESVRGPENPEDARGSEGLSQPTPTGSGAVEWVVGVIVLLAAGLFAFFLMGLGMAYSSDGCAQFPGCDDAVFDAFVAGVCVLVGSFVVAMAVAIWRRRSRLMYWALLGYLLAFVLFSWGYNRALESRWPG